MTKEILTQKRLKGIVHGVGINDANYDVYSLTNGKYVPQSAYLAWASILKRCYSEGFHKEYPTYKDCEICKEWVLFSEFKKWHDINYIKGFDLDKDLLIDGNKTYSPKACVYVPQSLNRLFIGCDANRGEYPKGVYFNKAVRKFISKCQNPVSSGGDGKRKHLGVFSTANEAYRVYCEFKSEVVKKSAKYYLNNNDINLILYKRLIVKANDIYLSTLSANVIQRRRAENSSGRSRTQSM